MKHGGGSVMVWGCMSALGVGKLVFIDDTMDKHVYLSILKEHLHARLKKWVYLEMSIISNKIMNQNILRWT